MSYIQNISNIPLWGSNAIIHEDVFTAMSSNVIAKLGNPLYNNTSYATTLFQGKKLISFGGTNQSNGHGLQINVPSGYSTAWVRVVGDKWNVFNVYLLNNDQRQLGHFGGGNRRLNNYHPGGGHRQENNVYHEWIPINTGVTTGCQLALISKPDTESSFWVSGIAFSRNPLNISEKAGMLLYWNCDNAIGTQYSNGGGGVGQNSTNPWNNDQLVQIPALTTATFRIPIVPNGSSKSIYIVDVRTDIDNMLPRAMTVNGATVLCNWVDKAHSLSYFHKGKPYNYMVETYVPASLFPSSQYQATISINTATQGGSFFFRAIGTLDWI
jgi:hypothetical protein